MATFKTKGTCAREIHYDIQGGKVVSVDFVSGCPGNLLGIKALVEGRPIDEVIEKFQGIGCGSKTTSCPDQLSLALKAYKEAEGL